MGDITPEESDSMTVTAVKLSTDCSLKSKYPSMKGRPPREITVGRNTTQYDIPIHNPTRPSKMKVKTLLSFFTGSSKKSKNEVDSESRRSNQIYDGRNVSNKLKSGGYEEATEAEPVRRYCKSMPDQDSEREKYRPAKALDDTCHPRSNRPIEPPRKQRHSNSVQQGFQQNKVHFHDDLKNKDNMIERANRYKEKMKRAIEINESKDGEIRVLKEMLRKSNKQEQLLKMQLYESKKNSVLCEQRMNESMMMQYRNYQNEQMMLMQQGLWDTRPPSSERQVYHHQNIVPAIYNQRTNNNQLHNYGNNMGGPMQNGNSLATSSYQWPDRSNMMMPGSASTPLPTEDHRILTEAADTPSSMTCENHYAHNNNSIQSMRAKIGRKVETEENEKKTLNHQGMWEKRPPISERDPYHHQNTVSTIYNQRSNNNQLNHGNNMGGPIQNGNLATRIYEAADTASSMTYENQYDNSLQAMRAKFRRNDDSQETDEIKDMFARSPSITEETDDENSELLSCDLEAQLNI